MNMMYIFEIIYPITIIVITVIISYLYAHYFNTSKRNTL